MEFNTFLPTYLYFYFGLSILVILCVDIICRFTNIHRLIKQKTIILELVPPAATRKTPIATEQFFTVVHAIASQRSWLQRFLGQNNILSLEVVSTRKQGIRYHIRLAEKEVDIFKQQLTAYLPDVRFKKVDDYILTALESGHMYSVTEFHQSRHFVYPLANHESLAQHDPIAYITGSMTKLSPDELVAFQIVLSPTISREARDIGNKIMSGQRPNLTRISWPLLLRFFGFIFYLINQVLFFVIGLIGEITRPTYELPKSNYAKYATAKESQTTIAAQAVTDSMSYKISQPLFRASIRTLVISSNGNQVNQNTKSMQAALGSFDVHGYQSLTTRSNFPAFIKIRYHLFDFKNRLLPFFVTNNMLLSVSEVASLYHFPFAGTTDTENIVTSFSKTLPAPISLKNDTELSVLIGENDYHGSKTAIGLTSAERERHMYIIGGTGNGKTTMLLYSIIQDIKNGNGVAVIDPHGDLAETILRHIPKNRIKDVIYLNPDDLSHPISINLLELPKGLSGDDLLREKDLITESTISVLRKIFSDDDTGGHRIEYVLRNTIQTALTVEGSTLFTIFRLLNDAKYRKAIVRELEDEDLKNFWINEIGKAGDFQRVKMSAGITAKIGRFLFSASARRMLEQEKSTIDFNDIINTKKIFICNFSKGLLGEDTSALFGTAILAKIQMAALRRARQKQSDRSPYYLYVDEFQNFATMSFVQMLSEARKYKLFLTMAEQSTSQQDQQRLVDIILANVGTVVAFRSGSPIDEQLILPLFSPYINEGEIANLPAYCFYIRIAALDPQAPMSGMTVLLDSDGDDDIAKQVIASSRKDYGCTVKDKAISAEPPKISEDNKKQATRPRERNEIKNVA